MKRKILNFHFAFFLRDIVDRPDALFGDLNSSLLNIFDAMPQIIPVPREVSPEIPVVVLRSENNEYVCNIARSRIDFILQRIDDNKSNQSLLNDFRIKVSGLIKYILEKKEITRFGKVARFFYQDNTAIRTIKNKYFNNTVDGVEELSLRFNKKTPQYGYNINDILEITAADILTFPTIQKGILIQRDINNDLNGNKTFTPSELIEIFIKNIQKFTEQEFEGLIK